MPSPSDLNRAYVLAFETSGPTGSVALGHGGQLIEARTLDVPRQHAQRFISVVAKLCEDRGVRAEDIGAIHVSSGPGSFTGLRVGIIAARMFGLAGASDLVPVPTLEVIAQNALDRPARAAHLMVMLDAKRSRVYAASFQRREDRYEAMDDPAEVDPTAYWRHRPDPGAEWSVMGEGASLHRHSLAQLGADVLPDAFNRPRAEVVFRLGTERLRNGLTLDRHRLVPDYIRPPEAEEKWTG